MVYPAADNQTFHGFTEVPDGSLDVLPAVVTPLLYRRQPFRLIGLPVLASERETTKRLELLRQSLELGTAEYRWSFAPGFAPSEDEFVSVGRALKDPRLRFGCELFWFWPSSYPEPDADRALEHLAKRETDQAVALWRVEAEAGSVVALHNLAVFFHLQALSGERIWGVRDEQRRITWTEALARWQRLAGEPEFWALVEKRLQHLEEPQLPLSILGPLREGLLSAIAGINAQLASVAVTRDDSRLALWHADLLQSTFATSAAGHALLERCVKPLTFRLEARREDAARAVKANPAQGLSAARNLLEFDSRELELISRICGETAPYLRELQSALATTVLDAVVRYQRITEDNHGCLPCLDRLMVWPLPPELAERIRQARAVIAEAAAAAPQVLPDAEIVFDLNGRQLAIGPDGVRLDDQVIGAEQFTGYRYGAPSGDPLKSLVFGWWSVEAEINLGSPPHLPGGQAGADLHARIVAACDRWLVPGLIERLRGLIESGESLNVGSTSLTSHGVLLSSAAGSSTGRALVSYSDVQLHPQGEHLVVASRTNGDLAATFSLREDWNAVIVPQLIAALTPS